MIYYLVKEKNFVSISMETRSYQNKSVLMLVVKLGYDENKTIKHNSILIKHTSSDLEEKANLLDLIYYKTDKDIIDNLNVIAEVNYVINDNIGIVEEFSELEDFELVVFPYEIFFYEKWLKQYVLSEHFFNVIEFRRKNKTLSLEVTLVEIKYFLNYPNKYFGIEYKEQLLFYQYIDVRIDLLCGTTVNIQMKYLNVTKITTDIIYTFARNIVTDGINLSYLMYFSEIRKLLGIKDTTKLHIYNNGGVSKFDGIDKVTFDKIIERKSFFIINDDLLHNFKKEYAKHIFVCKDMSNVILFFTVDKELNIVRYKFIEID